MDQPVTLEILLWVIGVWVPVLLANLAWTAHSRAAVHKRINNLTVKVAEDYATNAALGEMERRLVAHLTRIERKVDRRNGIERAGR